MLNGRGEHWGKFPVTEPERGSFPLPSCPVLVIPHLLPSNEATYRGQIVLHVFPFPRFDSESRGCYTTLAGIRVGLVAKILTVRFTSSWEIQRLKQPYLEHRIRPQHEDQKTCEY